MDDKLINTILSLLIDRLFHPTATAQDLYNINVDNIHQRKLVFFIKQQHYTIHSIAQTKQKDSRSEVRISTRTRRRCFLLLFPSLFFVLALVLGIFIFRLLVLLFFRQNLREAAPKYSEEHRTDTITQY